MKICRAYKRFVGGWKRDGHLVSFLHPPPHHTQREGGNRCKPGIEPEKKARTPNKRTASMLEATAFKNTQDARLIWRGTGNTKRVCSRQINYMMRCMLSIASGCKTLQLPDRITVLSKTFPVFRCKTHICLGQLLKIRML